MSIHPFSTSAKSVHCTFSQQGQILLYLVDDILAVCTCFDGDPVHDTRSFQCEQREQKLVMLIDALLICADSCAWSSAECPLQLCRRRTTGTASTSSQPSAR